MEAIIDSPANSLRFDYKKLLIVIALVAFTFVISVIIAAKMSGDTIEEFTINDGLELAEEIYTNGEIADALDGLPLAADVIKKMSEEIARKLAKTTDYPDCEVYFLEVVQPGLYPVLGYGNVVTGYVELKTGDIWKVGMTGNGEKGRYSGNTYFQSKDDSFKLTDKQLLYRRISKGTYKQMIVLEKILIYTYSLWSGFPDLRKPPGCKIYR